MTKGKRPDSAKLFGQPFGYRVWLTPEGAFKLDWEGMQLTFADYDAVIVWLARQIIQRHLPPTLH